MIYYPSFSFMLYVVVAAGVIDHSLCFSCLNTLVSLQMMRILSLLYLVHNMMPWFWIFYFECFIRGLDSISMFIMSQRQT